MTEKTPVHLARALERRDSETVRDLVEKEFQKVARGEYKWLNELIDVGYKRSDIVELLLEEANDAPWIYCDSKDQPTRSSHLLEMPKNPNDIDRVCFSPPWMSKRNDIKKIVQQLCGLGGIAPTSRSLHDWNGEVVFEDNYSTSYITYSISSTLQQQTAPVFERCEGCGESWKWPLPGEDEYRRSSPERAIGVQPALTQDFTKWLQRHAQIADELYSIWRRRHRWCVVPHRPTSPRATETSTNARNKSEEHQDYPNIRLAMILDRLRRVLKGFCVAKETLQRAGLCLDEFTIAQIPIMPNASISSVQLERVSIHLATELSEELDKLSFEDLHPTPWRAASDFSDLTRLRKITEQILSPLVTSDMMLEMLKVACEEYPLQVCCLAAQFLCVGLVSYCQGHIGPIDSVFTNHSQERSVLLGWGMINGNLRAICPCVAVRLTKLTCLSEMTKGPLITFSLILERSKEGEKSQGNVLATSLDDIANKISRLGLDDVFIDERSYNVIATPQDILDTWGPGELVPSRDNTLRLEAIRVGGGVISGHHWPAELHWTAESGPIDLPRRSFRRDAKITVGAPVTENLTKCSFPWQIWRASCPLVHLAVEREKWIVNQRQLGLQVGPDHAALQAIQVWNRIPGKVLKEYYLTQGNLGMMEFLDCYAGVQMSCCTGVARRIPLQELLSDLMPKFCMTHMGEDEWKNWNANYDIVAGLRKSNAREWLRTLRRNSTDAYNTLLTHIHRILKVLEPTGLNRERTHMKLAWPKEGDLHRGLKVSCQDKHLWAQALVDSEEGVTFAYMTTTCLLCEGNSCQSLEGSWRMAPKCLGTAVLQYRNEVEQDDDGAGTTPSSATAPTTWTLQNGQSYHMWNEKRCIRLYAQSLPQQQYRLAASESAIPKHLMTRLFRSKRVKRNLLRERHHPEDVAVDVLIVDRE